MHSDPAKPRRLLSLGTDRLLFQEGSAVRSRFAAYAKEWDEIHVIVATGKAFRETAIGGNVWVYPTRSRAKLMYPFDMARLGRFIIARRGITHITCQDPFLTGMAGISLKKSSGLPLELQLHTDIGSPNFACTLANRLRKALALSQLPKADSIRAVSERIKRYLVGTVGIGADKVAVRPIAVDEEAIRMTPVAVDLRREYPRFGALVLMASRLTAEKDIALAIRAWPAVRTAHADAGLVIVGSGPLEKQLRELAARVGCADSIVFEPWADRQKLVSYYKTADLFLNTSLFEGYGMTLVEARAAGCRIVSTDVGVAREMGARIADGTPEAVSSAVIEALDQPR